MKFLGRIFMLDDDVWYQESDIRSLLPESKVIDFGGTTREFEFNDGKFDYYLRVLDRKQLGDEAPRPLIEDQLRRVIIHDRTNKLLQEKQEELYENALRRNRFKIYTE